MNKIFLLLLILVLCGFTVSNTVAQTSNGPLDITLPPEWSLKFVEKGPTQMYFIRNTNSSESSLSLISKGASRDTNKIAETVNQIGIGFAETAQTIPGLNGLDTNYSSATISGDSVAGNYALFTYAKGVIAIGILNLKGNQWLFQYTGATPMWIQAQSIISSMKGNSSNEDAKKRFDEFFHIQTDSMVSYKVAIVRAPDQKLADELKSTMRPAVTDMDKMNDKLMTENINRTTKGYTSYSFRNIYVSTNTNVVLETRCDDEWNKGVTDSTYFKDGTAYNSFNGNLRSIPVAQSVTPDVLAQFPQLITSLGFPFLRVNVEQKDGNSVFRTVFKNYPHILSYLTDPKGQLLSSEIRDWKNHLILFTKFSFSTNSGSWPSHAYTESYKDSGVLNYSETFDLLETNALAKDFSFTKGINQGGLGIEINQKNGIIIISNVFKESGAFAAGLKQGDELLEVNGTNVSSMKLVDVSNLLRGEVNSTVKITVLRDGQTKLDFNVTRHLIDTSAIMMEQQDLEQARQGEYVGKPLSIKFTAADGRAVDLSAMKGKVVLIDFWATWCGPCVGEIPHVKEAYEKFHDQGFEIVGISFDQDKAKLVQFVKANAMPWPQYFDGKGWQNQFGEQYGIKSIPTMWLIGKDGNLADINARTSLADKVKKLLEGK